MTRFLLKIAELVFGKAERRRALQHTPLTKATFGTIRLKLFTSARGPVVPPQRQARSESESSALSHCDRPFCPAAT
jgi:hypothetical protein